MLKHTQQKATPIKRKVFGAMHEGRRFSWELSVDPSGVFRKIGNFGKIGKIGKIGNF